MPRITLPGRADAKICSGELARCATRTHTDDRALRERDSAHTG